METEREIERETERENVRETEIISSLPIEVLRYLLSFISIDLIQSSNHHFILRRNETHPICRTLSEMIDTKWWIMPCHEIHSFSYFNHDSWDEEDVLRDFNQKNITSYIYKNCGLVNQHIYINVLCVKNGKRIFSSTQKYLGGYYSQNPYNDFGVMDGEFYRGFLGEVVRLPETQDQQPAVYALLRPTNFVQIN